MYSKSFLKNIASKNFIKFCLYCYFRLSVFLAFHFLVSQKKFLKSEQLDGANPRKQNSFKWCVKEKSMAFKWWTHGFIFYLYRKELRVRNLFKVFIPQKFRILERWQCVFWKVVKFFCIASGKMLSKCSSNLSIRAEELRKRRVFLASMTESSIGRRILNILFHLWIFQVFRTPEKKID